jgi:GTP-binding protein Era
MTFRCGTIAVIGRPNVGKSTLLNRLIGARISITSRKPQTTRHAIRGILTTEESQFIFIDTPGFQRRHGGALNKALNSRVEASVGEADVCLFLLAMDSLGAADREIWPIAQRARRTIIGVNRIDSPQARDHLLSFLPRVAAEFPGPDIVPISARTGRNVDELLKVLATGLPEQAAMFDADDITDRDERFLAAELVREKLFRTLGDEVPYGSVVGIDEFRLEGEMRRIHCTIYVERDGHKAIILGKDGERMKTIVSTARRDMEKLFGSKVYLNVWIKVKSGWSDDPASLRRFGLT